MNATLRPTLLALFALFFFPFPFGVSLSALAVRFVLGTAVLRRTIRMKALLVVPALLLGFASAAFAQPTVDRARNSVYLELFGNGGLYSLNYEREVTEGLRVRIGYAGWTAQDLFAGPEASMQTLPFTVLWSRGRGHHHAEIGGGFVTGRKTRDADFARASQRFTSLTGVIGYRYQRRERGFLFRAGFTPFYALNDADDAYPDEGFFPSVGISVGFGS